VRKKPELVLGLATGDTMVGVYRHLVQLHKEGPLDLSRVVTFNLDEYPGTPGDAFAELFITSCRNTSFRTSM